MIKKFKKLFTDVSLWCEINKQQIFLMAIVIYIILIVLLCGSILIAFWLNGLYPTVFSFQIQFAFAGVGTLIAGSPALWTLYKNNIDQYREDSQNNTLPGCFPPVQQSYIDRAIFKKGVEK